ncbi:MAG TPA: alpha/beta hydrolase [Chthoniobacter sp.]|nr:alpha/beta hydrolase [Chthoniobacter sp.]
MPSPILPIASRLQRSLTAVALAVVLAAASTGIPQPTIAAETAEVAPDNKGTWHGFDRYDFVMDEETLAITPMKAPEGEGDGIKEPKKGQRRCVLVVPKEPAPGHPWSWQGCYWNHEPQAEIELLKHGFCIAYTSANANLKPGKEWDAWYAWLTEKRGLSPKPCFIGMSRGGQYSYLWATTHPDKVSCIYADNPACDRESLGRLGDLAANNVPLFHVCGDIDPLLPDCTAAIESIYPALGGRISVMVKEGFGHHPHSLRDPKPIVDFILASVRETIAPAPDYLGDKVRTSVFYGREETYAHFADDGADITYRGPYFSGSYDRYQFAVPGMDPFVTVLAPQKAAPGKPWVYRVGAATRGDKVDLALLARGFHIITGPVPYNANAPQLEQWNAVYKHFVEHGFSAKPAMEGSGAAAGEAYAWAIANPENVSCIYAENPILRSLMTSGPLLDRLEPVAKAGVPLYHVCGSRDPWLNDNTRALEKRYQELGGKITVAVVEGAGHSLAPAPDSQAAVDFIVSHAAK